MRIRKRFLSLSAAIGATQPSDLQSGDHHHQPPSLRLVQHQEVHQNRSSSSDHTTQIGLQPAASDPNKTKDELESEGKKEIIKIADSGRCKKESILHTEANSHDDLVLKGWFEGDRLIPIKKRRGSFEKRSMKCHDDDHVQEDNDHEMMLEGTLIMKPNKQPKNKKKINEKRGKVIMEGSRCSRVNGRGWRCSQETLVGYSLCEHHLDKGRLRSMTSSVRGRQAQNITNASKKQEMTKLESRDYKEADQATSIDPNEFEDDDDEEEDVRDLDEVESMSSMEEGSEILVSKRRKKLGVVKARSLSSLLSQTGN